jgi:serine phosphatase RsbU (regulator of sigma subunit)
MPPIHRHADGQLTDPGADESGLPLGIADGYEYRQTTITLAPGDSLTMWTDGINEAMNERDESYTLGRIRGLVTAADKDIDRLGNQIVKDVLRFQGNADQEDDMCLVCLRRVSDDMSEKRNRMTAAAAPRN